MPGLSMGRGVHCHHPLPAQRLPSLAYCSPARQVLTSILVLLPKLEGQLDVPALHHNTVLSLTAAPQGTESFFSSGAG